MTLSLILAYSPLRLYKSLSSCSGACVKRSGRLLNCIINGVALDRRLGRKGYLNSPEGSGVMLDVLC